MKKDTRHPLSRYALWLMLMLTVCIPLAVNAKTWSAPIPFLGSNNTNIVPNGNQPLFVTAMTNSGGIYFMWEEITKKGYYSWDPSDIAIRLISRSKTGAWSPVQTIYQATLPFGRKIYLDKLIVSTSGLLTASWGESSDGSRANGNNNLAIAEKPVRQPWLPIKRFSVPKGERIPTLAMNHHGDAVVVWGRNYAYYNFPEPKTVIMVKRPAGQDWGQPTLLHRDTTAIGYELPVVTENGDILISLSTFNYVPPCIETHQCLVLKKQYVSRWFKATNSWEKIKFSDNQYLLNLKTNSAGYLLACLYSSAGGVQYMAQLAAEQPWKQLTPPQPDKRSLPCPLLDNKGNLEAILDVPYRFGGSTN